MPPTETRITQAYFIREDIQRELATVVRNQRTGPIPDFLAAWDAATTEHVPHGLTPLLQIALTISSVSEVCACIGWMNRHGIGAPLVVYAAGDPRNHQRCRVTFEEGEPRIGIPEYWLWSEHVDHRRAYATYVHQLSETLGLPVLRKGYGAEREFAHIYPSATERDPRINLHTWSELRSAFRTIDWTALLTGWGIRNDELAGLSYNVTSTAYLHHLQSRLRSWSIERWRGWLALQVVQWLAGCSPHGPLRTAWHDFAMRHMQGVERDVTPKELRLMAVQSILPTTLGAEWVKQFCSPALRSETLRILENVRAGAAETLETTSWMAPATRAHAIRKLRAMDVQVCWPPKWQKAWAPCGLDRNNLVSTMLTIASQATDRSIGVLRGGNCRDPDPDLWSRSVYDVNAFYYPENNRFILPAAILRTPFYDPHKSLMWNYGAIGATMGHEFCHAFDADGRHYDERGDYRDWWTEADDREYKKRAAALVKLYESVPYRGMAVNGELTLLENIADIGGLEFALAGAKKAIGRALTNAELREFFRAYAVSWRSKDRKRRAAELLEKDPHAPPLLRVNHTVRQFDEWYQAFNVNPECGPEHRVRFFG